MAATYTVGEGYASALNQTAIDLIPGDLSSDGGQGKQWGKVYYYDADDHSVAYPEDNGTNAALDCFTGFSNASAANYIDWEAQVLHDGKAGNGIIIDISTAKSSGVRLRLGYTQFHGFEIIGSSSVAADFNAILVEYADGQKCYNNIIHGITQLGDQTVAGVYVNGTNNDVWIYNNIIYDLHTLNETWWRSRCIGANAKGLAGHPLIIANNTCLPTIGSSKGAGISLSGGYTNIINNYCGNVNNNNGIVIWGTHTDNNVNYNITSDASADDEDVYSGTGNRINKAAVDQFINVPPGSEDLNLLAWSKCRRKGQNNSALFTTDITGATRENWNCGAFETFPDEFRGRGSRRGGRFTARTWK